MFNVHGQNLLKIYALAAHIKIEQYAALIIQKKEQQASPRYNEIFIALVCKGYNHKWPDFYQ